MWAASPPFFYTGNPGGFSGEGQAQVKGTAFSRRAFDPGLAAVFPGDFPDQGQSQAGAADGAGGAEKALKNPFVQRRIEAFALIPHPEQHAFTVEAGAEDDGLFLGRIFDGVVQQIFQGAIKMGFVGAQKGEIAWAVELEIPLRLQRQEAFAQSR